MTNSVKDDAIKNGFPAPLYDLLITQGILGKLIPYFRRQRDINEAEAEDLAHEVVISAIRQYDRSREPGDLEAWLWALARHTLVSYLRSHRAREVQINEESWLALIETLPDTQTNSFATELESKVQAAFQSFAKLKPGLAEILKLSIENRTFSEIAGYLGITESATRARIALARKEFRPFVEVLREELRDVE